MLKSSDPADRFIVLYSGKERTVCSRIAFLSDAIPRHFINERTRFLQIVINLKKKKTNPYGDNKFLL